MFITRILFVMYINNNNNDQKIDLKQLINVLKMLLFIINIHEFIYYKWPCTKQPPNPQAGPLFGIVWPCEESTGIGSN